LIVDEHRGQSAFRNLEVVTPHEQAVSPFCALPGSGDVVRDPVAPLVYGAQEIAAVEGIGADVALGEEPTPQHHSAVDKRGAGVNDAASQRAIPVGTHDEVEVEGTARQKMQRRAVRRRFDPLDGRVAAV
jgi:hypothetical protein